MKKVLESQLIIHNGDYYYDISENPKKFGSITDKLVVLSEDKYPKLLRRMGEGVTSTNDDTRAYFWIYSLNHKRQSGFSEVNIIYSKERVTKNQK